jgi:mxaJ protein
MSSRSPEALILVLILAALAFTVLGCTAEGQAPERLLKVCADPNNLPFTNQKLQGFENELADLVARDLHATVRYTWWPQRRGFIRNTLRAGACDVVLGIPSSFELALATRPYYRSIYVFVSRKDRGIDVRSFDDPVLKTLRIGVQMIGDDGNNAPPAHALANRGITGNVVGYTVYGDYSQPTPRPASSKPWPGARSTSPWSGGRSRATSPGASRCPSRSCPSRRRSTCPSSPSSSTSRWACGGRT